MNISHHRHTHMYIYITRVGANTRTENQTRAKLTSTGTSKQGEHTIILADYSITEHYISQALYITTTKQNKLQVANTLKI